MYRRRHLLNWTPADLRQHPEKAADQSQDRHTLPACSSLDGSRMKIEDEIEWGLLLYIKKRTRRLLAAAVYNTFKTLLLYLSRFQPSRSEFPLFIYLPSGTHSLFESHSSTVFRSASTTRLFICPVYSDSIYMTCASSASEVTGTTLRLDRNTHILPTGI